MKRHGCLSWLREHADDSQRLLSYPRSFGDRAVPVAERLHKLTHLKSKINQYSGGFTSRGKGLLAYGAIGSAHYVAYFQLTADNKNGIILLLNQRSFGEDKVKDVGYQILKKIRFATFSKN